MPSIRIVRNDAGNCVNFEGTTNPAYWNACLSAEITGTNLDLINVKNDVRSLNEGETKYEFFEIPYQSFVDADNNPFANALDCKNYIDAQCNVAAQTDVSSGYRGEWDALTNTPEINALTAASGLSNGDWYYVNASGDINPNTGAQDATVYYVNDVVKYTEDTDNWGVIRNETIRVDQLKTEVENIVYNTTSVLFNTQAAVYADGDKGGHDPNDLEAGWYYRNDSTGAGKINWYYTANLNPENEMTLDTLKGMYAVIKVINTEVPYFSLYTKPQLDSNNAAFWYRSRLNYLTLGALDAYAGQTVLIYWGEDPTTAHATIPHVELTLDPSTSNGPQAVSEEILFGALSTSSNYPDGSYEFIAKALGYINNNARREYILETNDPAAIVQTTDVQSTTQIDFVRDATNTSIILNHDGSSYGVNTIKAVLEDNGTISIKGLSETGENLVTNISHTNVTIVGTSPSTSPVGVVNALNALFTVNPLGAGYVPTIVLPTQSGVSTTNNLQEGNTPVTGNPLHLYTTGSDVSSGHGARLWTDETIDHAGEYFEVKVTGQGRFILGLVDTANATDMAELTNNSGNGHSGLFWGNAFYDYGSYSAPWTTYGTSPGLSYGPGWTSDTSKMMRYNTEVQDNIDNMEANLYRVGIDENGYIYVAYFDAGRSNQFIVTARRSTITPASDYALVVKLWSANATIVESPTVSLLDAAAPALAWRYVESPDGQFQYPLFATAEEAEYADLQNGGDGSWHTHVYADDPTFTEWKMPTSLEVHDAVSAPTDPKYSEIPTGVDADFLPATYADTTITVDEGASLNIQTQPQDTGYTTTFNNLPLGLMGFAGNIAGNAPAVAGDNVTNPSDSYDIEVVRTNSYGSTTGILTLVVNNLTAPVVDPVTGFTHVAGTTSLVDADTLDDGSAVTLDSTVADGQRIIIPKAWVEANILPFVTAAGTGTNSNPGSGSNVFLGIATGDLTDGIVDADFDGFIAWEYQTANGHRSRLVADTTSNTGIGSITNAFYDYAIEVDGTDIHFIACNVNAINNEPAVNNGGSFSRVVTLSGHDGSAITLTLGTKGTPADLSTTGLEVLAIPAVPTTDQVVSGPVNYTPDYAFNGSSHDSVYETYTTGDDFYDDFGIDKIDFSSSFMTVHFKDSSSYSAFLAASNKVTFDYPSGAKDWEQTFDLNSSNVYSSNSSSNYIHYQPGTTAQRADMSDVMATAGVGVSVVNITILGPESTLTPWNKALDFTGSNEYAKEYNPANSRSPLRMAGVSTSFGSHADLTRTSDNANARPWATCVVFNADGHASNQHIWNAGEGNASINDDNIYLRLAANGQLFFGWGRDGEINECLVNNYVTPGYWYAIYIAHKGQRLNGASATAQNLADSFDIYQMSELNSFTSLSSNLSTSSAWTTTGARMDRQFSGLFTVGGRSNNRSFHGEVASMIVTTLNRDVVMPDATEVQLMMTDPDKWVTDYKVGNSYRMPLDSGTTASFARNDANSAVSTWVWLMGDAMMDSYPNIRNTVSQSHTQSYLVMTNMVSSDIQNVSIHGLS